MTSTLKHFFKMAADLIEQKVNEIIALQLGLGEEEVVSESSFAQDLGADSLDLTELVMAFEEEFDLDIPEEDAKGFETVQDVVNYLTDKVR